MGSSSRIRFPTIGGPSTDSPPAASSLPSALDSRSLEKRIGASGSTSNRETLRYHRREVSANEGRFVESGQDNEEAAQPGMVRAKRSRRIPLTKLDEESWVGLRH